MYDYHMHSCVSFDSEATPEEMVRAAESAGLSEICFTDHYDFNDLTGEAAYPFTIENYRIAYEKLRSDKIKIRRGVEFGLTPKNQAELSRLLGSYSFDFVIGSIHYVHGSDPYYPEFWSGLDSADKAFEKYLLHILDCVSAHSDFDVLGHLNYVCRYVSRSPHGLDKKYLNYGDFSDICDEIFKALIKKGKGLEINTSGYDDYGEFIPSIAFIKRFRELGGEIITVGSDAHFPSRVGERITEATEIAKDIFGYVCTFENRKPIFHKL
ncbi:MAG: histidinol-phosphatase HisJ family protein [Ruminococcaceae bacterium]|nr:histidinol-phosphatase HisJ family protein [Oscillospiraceae bacterium]